MSELCPDRRIKVVIIGSPNVGKTSLISRYVLSEFDSTRAPTVASIFSKKSLKVKDTKIELQICDTVGLERYQSLAPNFYRGADAGIIVFDLTSNDTFDRVSNYMAEISAMMPPSFTTVLVGNKNDLINKREVEIDDCFAFSESRSIKYFDASALTGDGVPEIFNSICEQVLDKDVKDQESAQEIDITKTSETKARKCCG